MIFFLVSFFFNPTTNSISGNACNAKWKKKGDGLTQKIFNWLHFFFFWLFLYHKEVSRVFSSTLNIAWQFSYQWNQQRAILPQTLIHMYANLVKQNLILALSWSLCLYFFKSCFLLDAVSEKYSYISLMTLLKLFVWPRTFSTIFLWLERKRNSLICCRIQQKIHETHKICMWLESIRSWHKEFAYLLYNSTENTWKSQNLAS